MADYNYLEQLNPQQRAAVEYCDGPALVIAGAAWGKTRVLTYKIVHLLRLGIEPYRILALTFTNKAAREMKSRISQVVGERVASRLWMGTFHSTFLRIRFGRIKKPCQADCQGARTRRETIQGRLGGSADLERQERDDDPRAVRT